MASVAGASAKRQAASGVRESDKSESSAKCSQLRQPTTAASYGANYGSKENRTQDKCGWSAADECVCKGKNKKRCWIHSNVAFFLFRALSASIVSSFSHCKFVVQQN